MPIYEFKCNNCKEEFEKLCKFKDCPDCPKCDSNNITGLISLSDFILKGTGWYQTDYKNK